MVMQDQCNKYRPEPAQLTPLLTKPTVKPVDQHVNHHAAAEQVINAVCTQNNIGQLDLALSLSAHWHNEVVSYCSSRA
ncbi:hypothetical protein H4W00_002027 [Psychrobacter sp. PL19]